MKARQLSNDASYGPDALKALFEAFDDAWRKIAPTISTRTNAVEATRLKRADVILGSARADTRDAKQLAEAAVQLMLSDPTGL
jgi:hypothetical protein